MGEMRGINTHIHSCPNTMPVDAGTPDKGPAEDPRGGKNKKKKGGRLSCLHMHPPMHHPSTPLPPQKKTTRPIAVSGVVCPLFIFIQL